MVPLLCGWLIDITVIFPVTMMRSGAMEILLMVSDEYTHGLWLLADLRERFLPSAKTTKRFAPCRFGSLQPLSSEWKFQAPTYTEGLGFSCIFFSILEYDLSVLPFKMGLNVCCPF